MLQSLHIQNFALIEDLHIVFAEGVTIFTGETGAGKSIIIGSVGARAGRPGRSRSDQDRSRLCPD